MHKRAKMIIIDHDQVSGEQLAALLQKQKYTTQVVSSAKAGWRRLRKTAFDLILLDLDLPDTPGLAYQRAISEFTSCPIVILSRRNDEESLVAAFEAGVAPAHSKPFSQRELLARLKARLRPKASSKIKQDSIEIDLEHQFATQAWRVKRDGKRLRLSNTEWHLLRLLIKACPDEGRDAPQIVSYQKLLNYVRGDEYRDQTHYLHLYIGRLRRKIEKNARQPRLIINEQGVGYRFYQAAV